jgi:uncharacterized protein
MILDETIEIIKDKYGSRFETITIEKLVAGIYFTAVKLSNGFSGLAYTNLDPVNSCYHNREKGFGDFTPGNFAGRRVASLFGLTDQTCFVKTVQLAVINALSAELLLTPEYTILENQDPFDLIDLTDRKQILVFGAFLSYLRKIADSKCSLQLIELNEAVVPDEYRKYLVPSGKSDEAIAVADVIIITGASLANGTLEDILKIIIPGKKVILVGPTSSLVPDVLFARGVNIVGSTRITDNERMFQLVAEGAAGYHLFNYCATKICLVNES